MKQKPNRIAEQSKKWLIEALFDLMEEKPYSTITVKEISDKAQLSRRTFYRNFKVKEDLLYKYTDYLFEDYIKSIKENTDFSFNSTLINYFEFWNKHIKELELLKKNHLFYFIMEKINSFIPDINEFLEVQWHDYDNHIEEKYMVLYNIGGLWNVLSKWIDNKERESPKEIAQAIEKAIRNFSKSI
ncbi:TetR/AcrR family transcriptional regulator [Clostridium sp. ZBS4]|uniref:TetR/AcrR family transcriptional regulator n=1 Tax=Clostridium sp. ZBS4 TaxID=2949974 RepID=UPI002079F4D6|nr:TetR/AcrR family transcriptional regulator [Clostridium sp. ZBS4]